PSPQRVLGPTVPGARLATLEDPVVVQAEQLSGMKPEPWRGSGGLLGELRPGGEMLTVARNALGKTLMLVGTHGETPTTSPRHGRPTAGNAPTSTGRPDPIRPILFQVDIPQEPAQRSVDRVAGNSADEALAIDEKPLAAHRGLMLTQRKHQVR